MSAARGAGTASDSAWPMLRAMAGAGVLCGLLIVGVFHGTRGPIARNRARALERAIFEVLPEARSYRSFRPAVGGGFERAPEPADGGTYLHAGYDDAGRLVGFAIEAEGVGYQDTIRLIYGYAFDRDAIIGLRVLASRETPGLGDRVETDADFLENFDALSVALSEDLAQVAHPIEAVRHGSKVSPWQIDGITGATISSSAIADILRTSSSRWIPRIRRNLDDFRRRD